MTLKRYKLHQDKLREDPAGEWVRFSDAVDCLPRDARGEPIFPGDRMTIGPYGVACTVVLSRREEVGWGHELVTIGDWSDWTITPAEFEP
jgi:hypothetical protein